MTLCCFNGCAKARRWRTCVFTPSFCVPPLSLLLSLVTPAPLFLQACKLDFCRVLHAANNVAQTLVGSPCRCLYLDVAAPSSALGRRVVAASAPTSAASTPVTVAYLAFRDSLWAVLLEGAHVTETMAGTFAGRLFDAAAALLGPGLCSQRAALWAPGGGARDASAAALRRLCVAGLEERLEYSALPGGWAAAAQASADAAARRAAAAAGAQWPEAALVGAARRHRAALASAGLRPPRDALEGPYLAAAAAAAIATVGGRPRALGAPAAADLTPPPSPPAEGLPPEEEAALAEEEADEAAAAAAGVLLEGASQLQRSLAAELRALEEEAAFALNDAGQRLALSAMDDFLDGAAAAPDGGGAEGSGSGSLSQAEKMRVLRRLRLSTHGTAAALCLPGLPPWSLCDRLPSHGVATLAALVLGLLSYEPLLRQQGEGVWAPLGGAEPATADAPPLPPAAQPAAVAFACTQLHAFGVRGDPVPGGVASDALPRHVRQLVPASEALLARGALLTPGSPRLEAAGALPFKLHVLVAAVPLPAVPVGALTAPAPPPAAPLPGLRAREALGDEPPPSPREVPPHLLVILTVHQAEVVEGGEGEEEEGVEPPSAFETSTTSEFISTLEGSLRRSAASLALSPALAHLGAILADAVEKKRFEQKG
jgi:hypothetical protein